MKSFSPALTTLPGAVQALTEAEQSAWEVMKLFRVFGPSLRRSGGHHSRQELPDHVRFCEECGRPHDGIDTTWRVAGGTAGGYVMLLPPQGPICDTCGRPTGVTSTMRLVRWGQGWRVVEWHRFDFLLLGADIWGTLDERPVSFLVEAYWEDDTYRLGDEVYFHYLVGLFQTLRQEAPDVSETALDDILCWIRNEEKTGGTAMDGERLDVEGDDWMPWIVDLQ